MAEKLKDSNGNIVTSWRDTFPHGTAVASMAVGKTVGVAKRAGFIGVKFRDNATYSVPEDLVDCWSWIVADVIAKNRVGKAIINMSYGEHSSFVYCRIAHLLRIFKASSSNIGLMSTATWITVA